MADIREVVLPEEAVHGQPGRQVDFDEAASELGCAKVELTKNKRPEFLAWVRSKS